MYADDQYISQELLKMNFTEIDILDKLVVFSDGQPTVAYFEQVLGEINVSTVDR